MTPEEQKPRSAVELEKQPMLQLDEHASELCKILGHTQDPTSWESVADWLTVASGVVAVEFDTARFNDNIGWCGHADEFDGAREELLQQYVTELTRFTYCWGALECAIDLIGSPNAPVPGKINNACQFLSLKSPNDRGFAGYADIVADLRALLIDRQVREEKLLRAFLPPRFVSFRGVGMYIVYRLRNQFVHGVLSFPMPDEENRPRSPFVQLIPFASRLTLLSVQHLLAADQVTNTETWKELVSGDFVERGFHGHIRSLHLIPDRDDEADLFEPDAD